MGAVARDVGVGDPGPLVELGAVVLAVVGEGLLGREGGGGVAGSASLEGEGELDGGVEENDGGDGGTDGDDDERRAGDASHGGQEREGTTKSRVMTVVVTVSLKFVLCVCLNHLACITRAESEF